MPFILRFPSLKRQHSREYCLCQLPTAELFHPVPCRLLTIKVQSQMPSRDSKRGTAYWQCLHLSLGLLHLVVDDF